MEIICQELNTRANMHGGKINCHLQEISTAYFCPLHASSSAIWPSEPGYRLEVNLSPPAGHSFPVAGVLPAFAAPPKRARWLRPLRTRRRVRRVEALRHVNESLQATAAAAPDNEQRPGQI